MPLIYSFPSSHYNVIPDGVPLDEIEIEDPAPPAEQGVTSAAVMRLNVQSQNFTNVRVTITPSRQGLVGPHGVVPPADWDVDDSATNSVIFTKASVDQTTSWEFTVTFVGSPPANVVFVYRVEADQLSEPVEQQITVAVG